MKAIFLLLFVFVASVSFAAADDPYGAALQGMPQQHSPGQSNVHRLTLEEAEQIALQANPEIRVAVSKVALTQTHVSGAGALDDPFVMYRGWQVPVSQPWNYNDAMNMFMVGRNFLGPGKRTLRSQIASDAVAVSQAELEATRRDVAVRVRKAFYDLLRNADELKVHDEQARIARQAFEAARIKYSVGKVSQQDALRAQIAESKLVEHLIMLELDGELSRATLNSLLGRSPDRPIEVAGQYRTPAHLPAISELEHLSLISRPELSAVTASLKQSEDEISLARKQYTPDFSANVGYMLNPTGSEHRNNYMIEGSMTLPWLNRRKHDAEISEAQAARAQRQDEFEAMRLAVFEQIQEALVRVNAAKQLVELYQSTLRPQAALTLQSTTLAYENDRTDILTLLDAQNMTLDVDFSYFRALSDFEQRMAELELAVGAPIERTALQSTATVEVTR